MIMANILCTNSYWSTTHLFTCFITLRGKIPATNCFVLRNKYIINLVYVGFFLLLFSGNKIMLAPAALVRVAQTHEIQNIKLFIDGLLCFVPDGRHLSVPIDYELSFLVPCIIIHKLVFCYYNS